jgi:hypothetical protein
MSVVVKKAVYEKASEGVHEVTVSRVEDVGKVETKNGIKDFLRVVFTANDQKDKEGKPVEIFQRYTKSLGSKANLYKFLVSLGFTPGAEFDVEDIVGTKAQVVVEHVEKDGETYANIVSVLKKKKAVPTEV